MKRKRMFVYKLVFFIFISVMISKCCKAQNPPQKINANYQFQSVGGDSTLRLPKTKGVNHFLRDTGMIYFNRSDKKIHWTIDSLKDTTILPAPPITAIQWGDGQSFRGDSNLRYDTSPIFVLQAPAMLVGHGAVNTGSMETKRLPNLSTTLLDWWPTIQGDTAITAPYGNFGQGIEQNFVNTDGQRDAVLYKCYNCTVPGVPANPNEIEMDRTIESHFVGTGMEFYDQIVYPPSLGNVRVRPFGYDQPFGSTRNNIFFPHFDQYEFFDEPGYNINFSFRHDGHFRFIGQIPECTIGLTDSATGAGIFIVAHNDINLGTQISSQSDNTHFAPTSIYWGLNVQGSLNEAVWSIETGTPSTHTMSQDTTNYLVDPVSLLSSFAYILPGPARDGQVVDVYAGGHIGSGTVVTSFSIVANVGFGQTLISATNLSAITLSAGQHFRLKFQALNSRWYYSN